MSGQAVSLITTVYNEARSIQSFLSSYLEQTLHAQEMVIVDGGSTDGTAEIIREFARAHSNLQIRLIVDETCSRAYCKGPIARGRNRAITEAHYPIIAVTDAGCLLDSTWFEEITRPFREDESADVVAGFYRTARANPFQERYGQMFIPEDESYLPSSRSIAFRKACWEKVGGYPEATYTAEDTLFDKRMLDAGCRFVWNRNALVTWDFARSEEELWRKIYQYGYGEGYLFLNRRRYLFRAVALLCPVLIGVKLLVSPSKGLTFGMVSRIYYHQTRGFLKGALDRVRPRADD